MANLCWFIIFPKDWQTIAALSRLDRHILLLYPSESNLFLFTDQLNGSINYLVFFFPLSALALCIFMNNFVCFFFQFLCMLPQSLTNDEL
jgi:hypothetical protein